MTTISVDCLIDRVGLFVGMVGQVMILMKLIVVAWIWPIERMVEHRRLLVRQGGSGGIRPL